MSNWDPQFVSKHACFSYLESLVSQLAPLATWPSLSDYNALLENMPTRILTKNKSPLYCVPQSLVKPNNFEEGYEQRVYLKGEIQTRASSWHDFLNLLVWMTFPITKAWMNEQQYKESLQQKALATKQRTLKQNLLAQFDECGIIVVSRDPALLEMIKGHRWMELFFDSREGILNNMAFFVLGHGLLEKTLNPYIGMTGKAVLISVSDDEYEDLDLLELDKRVTEFFQDSVYTSIQSLLFPLPLLGIPNWHQGEQDREFYGNRAYFR